MFKFHSRNNVHVTQIALRVQDLNKSEKFYKDILGFKVLETKENEIILTADGKEPIIVLTSHRDIILKPPRRTGLYHFAILLPDSIQLGLFLKHIKDKGYPIMGGSNHGVSVAIYLEDIDSNGIEVYADIDSNLWERKEDSIQMVTLPLDYDRLIKDTGDLQWEGMPSDTVMGHIHLHVADIEEAKKFYIEGIGMDLITEIGASAVFTSSAGYHHHIAFNIWNGKGARPLPENSAGMKYYVLKFPNKKAIEITIDKLSSLGYPSFTKNDGIFIKDPSGNLIKLEI